MGKKCALMFMFLVGCADISSRQPEQQVSDKSLHISSANLAKGVLGELAFNGGVIDLRHAMVVDGPDPVNKFQRARWYIFLEGIPPGDIEDPALSEQYLRLFGRGIRLKMVGGSSSIEINNGYGWKALRTEFANPVRETVAGNGELLLDSIPGYSFPFSYGGEPFVLRLNFHALRARHLRLAVTQKPALRGKPKPLMPDGGEPWKAYLAYCQRNSAASSSYDEYLKYLKATGRYPTSKDIDALSRHFHSKVKIDDLLRKMYKQDVDRFNQMPKQCKFQGGVADDTIALLNVEAQLEGGAQRFEAILVRKGRRWTVSDHNRWIPRD